MFLNYKRLHLIEEGGRLAFEEQETDCICLIS